MSVATNTASRNSSSSTELALLLLAPPPDAPLLNTASTPMLAPVPATAALRR